MKKILTLITMLITAALLLCGCGDGKKTDPDKGDTKTSVTASEIADKLKTEYPELDGEAVYGTDEFSASCEKLYGQSADKFSDGAILYVSSGKSADEISLLKGDGAKDLLLERKKNRAADFKGYAPEESKKCEDAEVYETNGFCVLVISEDTDDVKAKIDDILK